MSTENNEIFIQQTQTDQKQKWQQPQLTELDINQTESGKTIDVEVLYATGPS